MEGANLRTDLRRGGIIFCKLVSDVKFLMKWRGIMKKIMVNFVASFVILIGALYLYVPEEAFAYAQSCTTTCSTSNCETVTIVQSSSGWNMTTVCGGQTSTYSGSGQYNGTVCGGVQPCVA